jgi:hypothetical protein
MSRRLKVFLTLSLFFLIGIATISGLAFYYYSNPSQLKHLVEDALSVFTGTECSIQEISHVRKPRTIRLKGIELFEPLRGTYFAIPEIAAVISIHGGLGRRSLILEDLQVNGFTLTVAETWELPQVVRDTGEASLLRRILGGLFSFFVFKDIRVNEARLIDGSMTGRWEDRTINIDGIHATLNRDRFLEAGCGVRIRDVDDGMDLTLPQVTWITQHPIYPPGATIHATLRGEGVSLEAPQGSVSSAILETTMVFHRRERTLVLESFSIVSDKVTIHGEDESLHVSFPSFVQAKAVVDLHEKRLSVPSVRIALGDIAEFKGEIQVDFSGRQGLIIKVDDLNLVPENLISMLPEPMKQNFQNVGFTGPIPVSGRVAGNLDQHIGQWACELQAALKNNQISFASPGSLLQTELTGQVQLKGPLSDPEFHLNMGAHDSEARIGAVQLEKGRLSLSITGAYPTFRINELSLNTAAAKWNMGGRELRLEEIEVQTRSGSLDLKRKRLLLPKLSLSTLTLKNLLCSVEMTEEQFSAGVRGEGLHLAEFGRAKGLLPHGWKIKSTDSLQGRVLLDKKGRLTSSAELRIQGLSFESEDGDFVGENLSLVLEPAFVGIVEPQGKLIGTLSLSLGKGEMLYDRFYLDLNRHPLVLVGKGTYEPTAGSLELSDFRLHLEDLATINVEGTFTQDRPENSRFLVHVPRAPLGPIFRQFIMEPYKHQNPSLTDLRLEGLFSAELELIREGPLWNVKGRSRWQEGQAASPGQAILLQGIELDMPIWYEHKKKGAAAETIPPKAPVDLKGSLSIASAQLPFLPSQPINTLLKAGPDRLHTLSPLAIMTEGGEISIGRILFRDPFRGAPNIETALTVKALDLKPWLSTIWPKPVTGAARGKLDRVHWHGNTLTTQGTITADLFDGQLVLSNIGAKRFPSLTPVITLDAAWSDLDLAQITGDTAFGKIQGALRGYAQGLEIADGQPQAFNLFMETVKKKETPQKISVQAVDNIARIGGGASPFRGLAGAFVSFFRELPYEKIGISAVLENDVFRINGTIRENDKEYLIKKGGFSGVDVIIEGSGSNTISFKDMVRRIKRVTDSEEGPVIE